MKYLFLILLFSSYVNGYTQQCNFHRLDGSIITKCDGNSINSIIEDFFENVKMTDMFSGTDNKNCDGYEIIFKKYTETPLFLLGQFPKSKKKLKKCIDSYNVLGTYFGYSFKNDLDKLINTKKKKEYVIKIFGHPQRKTIDKKKDSEVIIYNYDKYYGTVKFDLVFVNNILSRYILSN